MKRILSAMIMVCTLNIGAQELNDIVEAETKAAMNRVGFVRNLNTDNYDLKYHRLEFELDPTVAFISGDVTSYFEAKEDLSQITFELHASMNVSQVIQRGNALNYTQNENDEVVITLPQVQLAGVLDSITISYSGNPINTGLGAFTQTTHNGDPIISTLSEPYGAKAWWPCKQDLIDKIDEIDVYITTPLTNPSNEDYVAVSNGIEQGQILTSNSKTTHFKHQFPIPAYLIAIAVTNYTVYTEQVANNGSPFDIVNYVFPESLSEAQAGTPITTDIMELYADLFEPYPFAAEKYGHAQFTFGGGMEHTTVSFMGNFSRNLVAHELAHQWFGNKITCGSWQDIWLNEGFATYLSGLVIENFDGNEAFTTWKEQRINSITSQLDGSVYLKPLDTTSISRIFNGRLSYNKGAMVLHMLRKKLGDTEFYQGMNDYLTDENLAFGYAKTVDYKEKMEMASGQNLTEFFNDWIYNEGYPSYTLSYNQIDPTQVRLTIQQSQSHNSVSYFEAPLPIRLHGNGGEILDVVLNNSENNEEFFVNVNFTVDSIEFDPEVDLISNNNTVTLDSSEFTSEEEFLIFPNPATKTFAINKPADLEIIRVSIFNILGQQVLKQPFAEVINVEKLSSGLHFVRFETNQGSIYRRLLKN